ncbi:hypothetical protein [Streptomyces thermolilacinus]|uniref:hypothetical protein n=1 Tax=Streptomyces thermolilacinus TaxID=285540 RepID=UPI0033EB172C
MPILAGGRLEADALLRLRTATYHAKASGPLTRTDTTYAPIPGASLSFTTAMPGAEVSVIAFFDCAVGTAAGGTDMNGRVVVDGTPLSGLAKHQMDQADRDSVGVTEKVTLASVGTHTVELQGALSVAAGSGTFQAFTNMLVLVNEQP